MWWIKLEKERGIVSRPTKLKGNGQCSHKYPVRYRVPS